MSRRPAHQEWTAQPVVGTRGREWQVLNPHGGVVVATRDMTVAHDIADEHNLAPKLVAALRHYARAGIGNSTDFVLQREAFDMAVKAIDEYEGRS